MTRWSTRVLAPIAVSLSVALSACGSSQPSKPQVTVTAGDAKLSLEPTLYCVSGKAQFADDDTNDALQVKPDTKVEIDVPAEVADAGWTIQIWSVRDTADGAVPDQQIGNVDAGKARSFAQFTTSDAVPDRYFVIVAIPEDPGCDAKGSAGIWTVLFSRVA